MKINFGFRKSYIFQNNLKKLKFSKEIKLPDINFCIDLSSRMKILATLFSRMVT